MKKEIIKSFDLEAYKKGVNVKTRDGHEVRIICTDAKNEYYPILGLVTSNGNEHIVFYTSEGKVDSEKSTIHAEDLVIVDEVEEAHKKGIKARRGRACGANIVPASTGAASAIGKVCPNLEGKLDGVAMRVPVPTGSVVDLVLELNTKVDKDMINNALKEAQNDTLKYTDDPIVSSDIIGRRCGSLVDGLSTNVLDTDGKQLVKIVAWYDNEMGYTAQMVRTAKYLMNR